MTVVCPRQRLSVLFCIALQLGHGRTSAVYRRVVQIGPALHYVIVVAPFQEWREIFLRQFTNDSIGIPCYDVYHFD